MLSMAIGLNIVCFVGFVICFVQCNPVAGQWDQFRHPDTHCWPRNVQIDYSIVGSSTSAFLDFAFAVYPGFVLWHLQMPVWKKLGTMALMGLGLAAFAIGVIKVSGNSSLLGNPNLLEVYTHALHIGLWNSIENDLIICAACLPGVPPLFIAARRSVTIRSTFNSLGPTSSTAKVPDEEYALEIARNGQRPGSSDQGIHGNYDFSFEHEPARRGKENSLSVSTVS